MDIRKQVFTEEVTKHWNGLSREMGSLSLEVFKRYVNVELGDMAEWGTQCCWVDSWTHDHRGLFQPELFHACMKGSAAWVFLPYFAE